jgi:thiamine biosynthesis lipoprotein
MKKKILYSFLLILFCWACRPAGKTWQATTFLYFDTVCEINLFCSQAEFESAKKEINRIFLDIEDHFAPGVQSLSSPSVISLYKKALFIYSQSFGCFDITIAPLSHLWGFRKGSHRVPTHTEIMQALEYVGMDKIRLTADGLQLTPGMELDWGGIAKGYGIDRVSQALIQRGLERGFINAGGDLYCWGENPDRKTWRIGIKHPRKNGVFAVLFITDKGAATTGDYQRFFLQDGIRYHHVFDPKTGYPTKGKQSVTVVGPETWVCDALSTALFVSGDPEKILGKFPEYGVVIIDSEGGAVLMGKRFRIQMED